MSFADQREAIGGPPAYSLHTWPRQYGFALIAVVVATGLRYPLSHILGGNVPFLLFYPTIWLVAWLAGLGPGVVAVFLSAVAAKYLLFGPENSSALGLPLNTNGLLLFCIAGVAISAVTDMYRRRAMRLQEFERAVEGLEEMIAVVDRDYRYVIANRAFLSYRGMKKEEVVGRRISEVLNPGVFEATVKEKLDECFRGKLVQYEMRYTYPGKGERDLFISYFPIDGPRGVDRVASVLQDVTDKKEAERSLKLFRALMDQSNDAVEIVDPDTLRFLDVNDKACTDLGYSREELLGMTVFDINPDLTEPGFITLQAKLREAGFVIREVIHRRKDGSTIPVEVSLKRVNLDRSYIVAVSRDISERKRANEALEGSEKRFQTVYERAPVGIALMDPDSGRFLKVNPKFCELLGRSEEELLKCDFQSLTHPDDLGVSLSKRADLTAGRTVQFELEKRYLRPDGGEVWANVSVAPMWREQEPHKVYVVMAQDITKRKRAEEALREREDRYRDLVENSEDLVCTHDLEGNLLSVNPTPARLLGYEVSELIRMPMRELIAPESREQFDAYLERIKTQEADQGLLCVIARNGERRIWEYKNTLRREGVVSPIVRGMARDITERKRAEVALRNSERRYRLLFEENVAGVAISSLEGKVLDCNGAWARILGYGSVEEVRGRRTSEFYFQPKDREPLLDELRRDGTFLSREMPLLRKDGTPVWVLFNCAVHSADGDTSVIQATAIDITERKKAGEALRRREEDYRRFVAQSSEGIFRQDMDAPVPIDLPEEELVHHILHDSYLSECNEAIAKMYGLTVQDIVGKRLTETLDPNDPRNIELTRDYIRSGFRVLERKSHEVDAQGNPKVFRNSMIGIVENGMLVRTWGIQRDVTEQVRLEEARNQAEKALQKSEAHFRLLVEQASDGIFIADAQGKYVDVNSAGAAMLGYTKDEILQLSLSDILEVGEVPRLASEVARFANGAIVLSEWKFRRKDGSAFPGEVCGKQLPDGRLQGILRDISERREAEEAMRQSEERFRVALKDSPITVFSQDRELRYTWIYNPQLHWQHDVIGKTDAEIMGAKKTASLMELKHQVLKTGVAARREVLLGNNGRNYAFDITVEPLFDARGSVIGITGAAMDIARLREMTDRLQDARDKLANEKSYLESEIQTELGFEEIIGHSEALCEVLKNVRVVAPTDSTVLLLGETGTGKELVARSLHGLSSRHDKTFVKLNCAAVPSGLLESELFGHEKGAFTGAVSQKVGRIELADKGTLFLDEIGELPLELQPKLLRVLQDREFERLGGVHTLHVDVRIISATNRDLHQDIIDRNFRGDLFYRLNVFPIELPSLRERRSDIPILVHHFVCKHAARMGKRIDVVPDETMKVLQNWNWPGNIRELENMIERMVILSKGQVLAAPPVELEALQDVGDDSLTEMARDHIIRVLRETNGVLSGTDGAASRLGLKRTTLQSMLKRHGIEPHEYRRGNGTFGAS
jgi:formate hydrogenlyase transcriptional activator